MKKCSSKNCKICSILHDDNIKVSSEDDVIKLARDLARKKIEKIKNPQKNKMLILNDHHDDHYGYVNLSIVANVEGEKKYYYLQADEKPEQFNSFNDLERRILKYLSKGTGFYEMYVEDVDGFTEEEAVKATIDDWEITEKSVSELNDYL